MAFQLKSNITEAQDFADAIIRQRNSCPICHLPLCYGKPIKKTDDSFGTDRDTTWFHIQSVMKHGIGDSSNLFGVSANKPNAQKCHLVGTVMIPQIASLKLYTTPAKNGEMTPDQGYYLYPEKKRFDATHKFMHWDFGRLCEDKTKFKMHEYLNLAGVHYFLACTDCNAAHTGHHQLQQMTKYIFNKDEDIAHVFSMYTIMFDNMANKFPRKGVPTIVVDDDRRMFWQTELWLNYCMIMFLAQQMKRDVSSQTDNLKQDMYRYTFAHRDMGMCDFYMNQILSTILYMNFNIEIDFIWLHQNFFSFLPQWAKTNGRFNAENYDYNCTWRLVLGTPSGDDDFCIREDIDDEYYIAGKNHREIANLSIERIHEFTKTWLMPIGRAITAADFTNTLQGHALDVRHLYESRIGVHKRILLSTIRFMQLGDDDSTLDKSVMEDPHIQTFHDAFEVFFPGEGKRELFENFAACALSRTAQAFKNADKQGEKYAIIRRKMQLVLEYATIMTA